MKKTRKKKNVLCVGMIFAIFFSLSGCASSQNNQQAYMEEWLSKSQLEAADTKEELYKKALHEDTLVIYSVSSRVFDVKQSFEEEYKGLTVEVKDIRGNDVVGQLQQNYKDEKYECDVVICSDNDGSLYQKLIEPGIIFPYVPCDIAPMMKEGHTDGELTFLGEAVMLFYNGDIFQEVPIKNIWELTEKKYKGKIIMANPLRSFSTYGFSAMLLEKSKEIEDAYQKYSGEKLPISDGETAGQILWDSIAANAVFTNSSDEVAEGIGNSGSHGYEIGIMISSKMRLQEVGYVFQPIYQLEPFSAVYTPNDVMIAAGAKNTNTAKLFVRYLLGETDGTGKGRIPYSTLGTWSTRTDVPDGNQVPLSQMDVISLNRDYIYQNREKIDSIFEQTLEKNVTK